MAGEKADDFVKTGYGRREHSPLGGFVLRDQAGLTDGATEV